MWPVLVFGGYATFVVVLAGVLVYVAVLRPVSTPAVRQLAFRMFRIVWTAGVVGLTGGLLKLHDAGLV